MLRPTPIRRYLSVMNAKGFSTAQIITGAGLDVATIESPQALIEVSQFLHVVDNMIALSGGEGLGLDVGLERDVKDFGILGYAALACRSVRHSVEEFWGGYGDALGMLTRVRIPRGSTETLTVDIDAPALSPLIYRFFVEEALCLLLKVGGQVSGTEPQFIDLQFSYPEPRYASRYRTVFHCPIRFGAARTRVTLSRAWFEGPLQTSDPELIQVYKGHLLQLQQQIAASHPLDARVRDLLAQRSTAIPPLDEVARELGLSPRTFRRQLQQQGQSYRKLVAEFRASRALASLGTGAVSAKQLSESAGFNDVNAFRRAFKHWTGKTVREYRARNAAKS